MSHQLAIDWSSEVRLPVSGRTPAARHGSSTGANYAAKSRGQLSKAMLDILSIAGPQGMSLHELSAALGRQLSSCCSVKAGLGELIVPSGSFEVHVWPDGGMTKRARWTLNRERMAR